MNLDQLLRPLFRQLAVDPNGRTVLGPSAVEQWPPELVAGAERARLIEAGPTPDALVCPGCLRACVRTVSFTDGLSVIHCNQADIDYGLIEIEPRSLRQWHASRSRVAAFVSRELELSPTDMDDKVVQVRLGTWRGARLRRLAILVFTKSAILHIGDTEIDVCELMKLDGDHIYFDHEELEIRAAQSADSQTGGKRYQPSRLHQQHAVCLTTLRNRRLQGND